MSGSILYEVHNLTLGAGTGIATYARSLARTASNLGYDVDGLWGVEKRLYRKEHALNEVLAFDAPPQYLVEPAAKVVTDFFVDNLRAIRDIKPYQLQRKGLVTGPATGSLDTFRNVFISTRLVEGSKTHFKLFQRFVSLRVSQTPLIFHATHPVPLRLKGAPNVYTIHDLVPLRLPYTTLDDKKYTYRLMKKLAKTADHIITVSEHSRRDIIEFLDVDERRVTNTYQTITIPDEMLNRSEDQVAEDVERNFELSPGGYFLFYGAIEPKKNLLRMIDGYAASGVTLPLIIVGGSGWQNSRELQRFKDEQFSTYIVSDGVIKRHRRVRRIGYLAQSLLVSLIRGARAVLFPSIYEGFGLPVVEAMTLGTPVITSNVSSLPEVAGEAAMLVNPHETSEIARAISAIHLDEDLRVELIARGRVQAQKFSQSAYERRLGEAYRAITGSA